MDLRFTEKLKFQFKDDLGNRDRRWLAEISWASGRTTAMAGKEAILPLTAPRADPAWGVGNQQPSWEKPKLPLVDPHSTAPSPQFWGHSTQKKWGHRWPELGCVRASLPVLWATPVAKHPSNDKCTCSAVPQCSKLSLSIGKASKSRLCMA